WDLNPRSGFPDTGFQDRSNQPLCHPSDLTIFRFKGNFAKAGPQDF
ncbi:MAG: hypothetical protein RL595_299, partial [Planctomycetota bacterium]